MTEKLNSIPGEVLLGLSTPKPEVVYPIATPIIEETLEDMNLIEGPGSKKSSIEIPAGVPGLCMGALTVVASEIVEKTTGMNPVSSLLVSAIAVMSVSVTVLINLENRGRIHVNKFKYPNSQSD